jgi:hypothetical protein
LVDHGVMDASVYAFEHGVHRTRATLRAWRQGRWRVLVRWLAGSSLAALGLLSAVLIISALNRGELAPVPSEPPFVIGGVDDVAGVLVRNLMVLALHAMACVAGFIAGSSLPLQAASRRGLSRWVHEHGGRIAIAFVCVPPRSRCPLRHMCSATHSPGLRTS